MILCCVILLFYPLKIGFYDGHESMENGGKSYVDRHTVRRSTCVRECTVRLHLTSKKRHTNDFARTRRTVDITQTAYMRIYAQVTIARI